MDKNSVKQEKNSSGVPSESPRPAQEKGRSATEYIDGRMAGEITLNLGEIKCTTSSDDDEFHQHVVIQALGLFRMDDECVGLLQRGQYPQHELVVKFCYGIADAMLTERIKRRESAQRTSAGSGDNKVTEESFCQHETGERDERN